jgi:hypothetical protein
MIIVYTRFSSKVVCSASILAHEDSAKMKGFTAAKPGPPYEFTISEHQNGDLLNGPFERS